MTGNGPLAWREFALASTAELGGLLTPLLADLRDLGFVERDLFGIRLALDEAVVNAFRHGNKGDLAKTVRVRYHTDTSKLLVEVQDEGEGFDPELVPDPLAPMNLERPGGRGVFLIRHYMTWVAYNDAGTCVTMCKERSGAPRPVRNRGWSVERSPEVLL